MELFSVLITGANRGIGLEFVRQFIRLPKPPRFLFATYRSSNAIQTLKEIQNASKVTQIVLVKMDVRVSEDVVAARKVVEETVGENGLTLLINNAGFLESDRFPNITEENLLKHFTINTVGPIRVFQEMLPLFQKAATRKPTSDGMSVSRAAVLNISSLMGCITKTGEHSDYDLSLSSYKISKAALNMAMRVIAAKVKDQGILVVKMCPGWVKTDMGTDEAQITPEESISAMLQTLEKLDSSHHGSFIDRYGNPYPY